MVYYGGILAGSADVWGMRIPDCPGCHGGGPSPDAAISGAISALREWAAEVRANVTFDAGLLEAIDAEAERRGLTRSAFLGSATGEKIEARG